MPDNCQPSMLSFSFFMDTCQGTQSIHVKLAQNNCPVTSYTHSHIATLHPWYQQNWGVEVNDGEDSSILDPPCFVSYREWLKIAKNFKGFMDLPQENVNTKSSITYYTMIFKNITTICFLYILKFKSIFQNHPHTLKRSSINVLDYCVNILPHT